MKKALLSVAVAGIIAVSCFASACGDGVQSETDSGIQSVTAIGFFDNDGVKLQAVAVEYGQDLTGADVAKDTFSVKATDSMSLEYIGNGKIGDVVDVYINDSVEVSESGGSGRGNYVIIEVFTDWTAASDLSYKNSLAVSVTQSKDITLGNGEVLAASGEIYSNKISSNKISFVIPELAGFEFYTDDPSIYGSAGAAYKQSDCFNQQTGTYSDGSLSYALCLPEGYHKGGNYAMVTVQNPAATIGTHPMEAVLAYRSAAYYANQGQQVIRNNFPELDGLIVLVPVITARVNDNVGTPAEYEAVVGLWDYIIEEYGVNENYIYGSGQSVGGMIVLETNRNRDNFFAGILLYDNQWAQNYYVDTVFARDMVAKEAVAATAPMHYPRTQSSVTWDYRYDGYDKVYEDHDPYNYYYLISDDNIMILNAEGKGLSNDTWGEMKYLYSDLVGYDLQHHIVDGTTSLDEQNADIKAFAEREGDTQNINWISFSGDENSRRVDASYDWLLSQCRDTEMQRDKLDLNKPFEIAEEQIQSEEREIFFTNADGSPVYYLTGKSGAGTQGYNTFWGNTNFIADSTPGWLPEGMSWENGVSIARIQCVTAIGANAIAIEYDKDMENLVVNLKGDKVYNHITGEYREDDLILLDPFEFYGADGKKLEAQVTNIYVNDSAEAVAGAARQSGSGRYVIIEFTASGSVAEILQRTTLRTDKLFANAYPWTYQVN
ncbi:MAG: hypothetical protein ACI4MH_05445 [Candidatus Coproplasma sp.]